MGWNYVHADIAWGAQAIKGDADAVSACGDGDAKAAADEKTGAAVNHSNKVGKLVWLQLEPPKTSLALLPQKTSDTLKIKHNSKLSSKLNEKYQNQENNR